MGAACSSKRVNPRPSSVPVAGPVVYPNTKKSDILIDMSKRLVDIDNELLEEASVVLGASTMKEAVNRSLEAVVVAARRRRHADRLEGMAGIDLDEPTVMSGAWR
jgi:Arc/MetJ family transcription regulator